jgi:Ca2+/Na+ antiporter
MANWGMAQVDRIARIGSHVVIWTIVLVPTVIEMIRGWRPLLGDDATITFRSYQVLSLHAPLVGMHSDAHVPGHILYDLGPLQFVLLTVPIHIDHLQGALWGSALIVGLVLSVAVEAMWSVRRWLACVLVALAVADLAWTAPSVFGHQLLNANFGLAFLLASIVLAWAVALGSFGWWPVLVFTASVTVQAQLFYALVAVSLVIVCPFLGGWHSGRPRRFRWLMIGVGVGIVCWLPTLIQEVFGSFGNLTGLLSARSQASSGFAFGLRNLGGIAWPGPLPVRQYDPGTSFSSLGSEPVLAGVVVLVVIAVIAGVAWRYRRKDLAALATIGLICSMCVVVDFASVPRLNMGSLQWLVTMLWLVAYLWWLIVVWAVIELVRATTLQRVHASNRPLPKFNTAFGVFILFGVLIVMVLAGLWRLPSQSSVNSEESAQVSNVVQIVASKFPPGAVNFKFWPTPYAAYLSPEDYVEYDYGQAILWQLTTAGFEPLMQQHFFTTMSGITYARDRSSPTVNVIMTDDGWSSQIQKVVIGTYSPPAKHPPTSVLLPSNRATLSRSTTLDASASNATSVEFRLFGGSYGYNAPVLCTAASTIYGWLCSWNTTTVPNGSYSLVSEAFGAGGSAFSSGVNITVKN